ncbi:hypothetical protein MNBD_PLANCTO03-285 [hydrothermal vent metagenome]|uniref:Uncharacterized protein n=1 Tax=hydrothermal vent metagenome TaxID=652676 RepID=A0A3B1DFY0_9ZZZZ
MSLHTTKLATLLAVTALAAPALAQVVSPPEPKPAPAAPYVPPAPPPSTPAPRPTEQVPQVDYDPITPRDEQGQIIPLEAPYEYVAMAHNPLITLEVFTKIAPVFYERRQRVEQLIIEHLGVMMEIENGLIDSMRMEDEEAMRETTGKVSVFTSHASLTPFLSADITRSGLVSRNIGTITQKIMQDHQKLVTTTAMGAPTTDDGATGIDQMMQAALNMSISEYEYFYSRLMMDIADQFGAVLPQLALDAETAAVVTPLADQLASEGDLDTRALLIREIFATLDDDTRKQAAILTIELRPEIDTASLMAPIPEGAEAVELDNETRLEIIFQLLDGGTVDTSAFVKK